MIDEKRTLKGAATTAKSIRYTLVAAGFSLRKGFSAVFQEAILNFLAFSADKSVIYKHKERNQ